MFPLWWLIRFQCRIPLRSESLAQGGRVFGEVLHWCGQVLQFFSNRCRAGNEELRFASFNLIFLASWIIDRNIEVARCSISIPQPQTTGSCRALAKWHTSQSQVLNLEEGLTVREFA